MNHKNLIFLSAKYLVSIGIIFIAFIISLIFRWTRSKSFNFGRTNNSCYAREDKGKLSALPFRSCFIKFYFFKIKSDFQNETEDMLLEQVNPQPEISSVSNGSLSEVFMEPLLLDEPESSFEPVEFNFEFSDHNYRSVTRKH